VQLITPVKIYALNSLGMTKKLFVQQLFLPTSIKLKKSLCPKSLLMTPINITGSTLTKTHAYQSTPPAKKPEHD